MLKLRWTRGLTVMGLLAAGQLLAGCQTKAPEPPPPQPETPAMTAEQAQAELQKADPRARVGQVADVDTQHHNIAVRGLPAREFQMGDPVSIVADNANLTPLATATVVNVVQDILVVKYQPGAGRTPRPGDLAVRIPPGSRILGGDQGTGMKVESVPGTGITAPGTGGTGGPAATEASPNPTGATGTGANPTANPTGTTGNDAAAAVPSTQPAEGGANAAATQPASEPAKENPADNKVIDAKPGDAKPADNKPADAADNNKPADQNK